MYDDAVQIEPEDLKGLLDRGVAPLILDVRSALEYRAGHVPGARHVPFWTMWWKAKALDVRRADPIVVYCGHGPRARIAASALRRRGYTNVRLLCGHWARWQKSGRPVAR